MVEPTDVVALKGAPRQQRTAIWGFCPSCAHWFACEGWFDPDVPQPCCPVCDREPRAIVNRTAMNPWIEIDLDGDNM